MTDRIDHAAEARRLNKLASSVAGDAAARGVLAAAQVHATLALVEQQRIANLIALAEARHAVLRLQVASDAAGTLTVYREHDEERLGGWHELRPDIAAALGIETGADDD